jgi:hypothetical protein
MLRDKILKQLETEHRALSNPQRQIHALHERIAKIERKKRGYREQAAEGLIPIEELRAVLSELNREQDGVGRELENLRGSEKRLQELDRLADMVDDYLQDLPQLIAYPTRKRDEDDSEDGLRIYRVTPDTVQPRPEIDQDAIGRKYRGLYENLQLRLIVHKDDRIEATGVFGQALLQSVSDLSKNKHATKHFHATSHPIVQSFQPGEDWRWCYVDGVVIELRAQGGTPS